MLTKDPLGAAEQIVILEELASSVRHDLRNRLGNIRNAAFWLRRRFEGVPQAEDPRVGTFFSLIDEEVFAADSLLERLHERFPPDFPREDGLADIDPLHAVEQAVKFVRLDEAGAVQVVAEHEGSEHVKSDTFVVTKSNATNGAGIESLANGSTVESAPGEIAVVVRALIELRAKTMDGAGRIVVRTRREANRLMISVPAPDERQGMWIDIAKRTAMKCGGSLTWVEAHGEAWATLTFPLGARRSLLIGLPRPAAKEP
ncbi:hypothetical protein LZC95_12830 [Pendulispora brunnea]|uniref:histidine kinase n=1 Tax=Pendulispora brunnea TaxID=2905690 RepID=A0ABZ2KKX7_9BACT